MPAKEDSFASNQAQIIPVIGPGNDYRQQVFKTVGLWVWLSALVGFEDTEDTVAHF